MKRTKPIIPKRLHTILSILTAATLLLQETVPVFAAENAANTAYNIYTSGTIGQPSFYGDTWNNSPVDETKKYSKTYINADYPSEYRPICTAKIDGNVLTYEIKNLYGHENRKVWVSFKKKGEHYDDIYQDNIDNNGILRGTISLPQTDDVKINFWAEIEKSEWTRQGVGIAELHYTYYNNEFYFTNTCFTGLASYSDGTVMPDGTFKAVNVSINSVGGTVQYEGQDVSGSVFVPTGKGSTFYVRPAVGYQIKSVTIDGKTVDPDPTVIFQQVAENHTLDVEFAPIAAIDNRWNVLIMIYQNVDTGTFKRSFTDDEIQELKERVSMLPYTYRHLSEGRMIVNKLDIQVDTTPITTISNVNDGAVSGWLNYGVNGDANFEQYLEGNDYNAVAVFAPLGGHPDVRGWYGLGGGFMYYKGKRIYDVIICDKLMSSNVCCLLGDDVYDSSINVLTHELLHSVETNSRFRGWAGFQGLHDGEENGYGDPSCAMGWLDWQKNLMMDTIPTGNPGFHPESFWVDHITLPAGR